MTDEGRRSLIEEIAAGGPLRTLFFEAVKHQQEAARQLTTRLAAQAKVQSIAARAFQQVEQGTNQSPQSDWRQCSAGCSACCYTPLVEVTPLEAIVAAEYLRRQQTSDELAALEPSLAASAQRRKQALQQGPMPRPTRCVMLGDDGLCQIYQARPLVCAGVFSLSREACEVASLGDSNLAENVPLDRPAKAWTMGVSGGLQRALVEAGLDGNLYELHSAVLRALQTDTPADRWLAGEDIFAGCYCTDAHSPPRVPANIRLDDAQSHRPTSRKGVRNLK